MLAGGGGSKAAMVQQQAMIANDAIDLLVVNRSSIWSGMLMSHYVPHSAKAIRAEAVNELPNVFQQRCVIRTAASLATVNLVVRTFQQRHELTARNAKGRTYRSHRSSPVNSGECAIYFYALAKSTDAFRMSFSSVLRPDAASSCRLDCVLQIRRWRCRLVSVNSD